MISENPGRPRRKFGWRRRPGGTPQDCYIWLRFRKIPDALRTQERGEIIMGGYGSGRWGTENPDAKPLVESCRSLDVNRLVREGIVRPDSLSHGAWRWSR